MEPNIAEATNIVALTLGMLNSALLENLIASASFSALKLTDSPQPGALMSLRS